MRRSHARPPVAEAFSAGSNFIAAVRPQAATHLHPKGTVLFRQGEPSRGGYLLLDGEARMYIRREDGRTVPLRTVGPGYLLGLPGTILNRAYLFTAKLSRDSVVAFLPTHDLMNFLRQRSDLCFEIVEMLGGELLDLPPVVHHRVHRHRSNA